MMQFGFLTFFEEGHIERVYGGGLRKPLAARVPFEVLHEQEQEEELEMETPGLTSDGGDEGGEETEIEFETEEEEQEVLEDISSSGLSLGSILFNSRNTLADLDLSGNDLGH